MIGLSGVFSKLLTQFIGLTDTQETLQLHSVVCRAGCVSIRTTALNSVHTGTVQLAKVAK